MKLTLLKSLALALVAGFSVVTAQAQTPATAKVVSVDVSKVLETYWKMKDYRQSLETFIKASQASVDKQNAALQEIVTAYNALNEKINKASEKDKPALQAELQAKGIEFTAGQDTLRTMFENSKQKIQEVNNQLSERAKSDVLSAADAVAKKMKADVLLWDRASLVFYGTFSPIDISAEVLSDLNKDHPAETKPVLTVPAK
jgi:Skp family chaperone for outer membrane proteins